MQMTYITPQTPFFCSGDLKTYIIFIYELDSSLTIQFEYSKATAELFFAKQL